jgi:hypothetical protein
LDWPRAWRCRHGGLAGTVPVVNEPCRQRDRAGRLLLQMTRRLIHAHRSYRFAVCGNGRPALAAERTVRADSLPAGHSFLNSP